MRAGRRGLHRSLVTGPRWAGNDLDRRAWRNQADARPAGSVTVRLATIDDAPGIGLVHVRSWQAAYRREVPVAYLDALDPEARGRRWAEILSRSQGTMFVVEAEAGIRGFCGLRGPLDAEPGSAATAETAALYVHPDSWRSGYGRSLCRAALETARGEGFHELILWVLKSNQPARRFDEAQGLLPDGATKTESHESGATLREVRYRCLLEGTA